MAHPALGQGVRFFLVALAGLAIDVSIASALALGGLPLAAAAATGFAAGLAFNYVAHAIFTFRQPREHASLHQMGAFLLASLAVLGVRLGVIELLEQGLPASLGHPTILILIATGASFGANFLILRVMVFAHSVPRRRLPANEERRGCAPQEQPPVAPEEGSGAQAALRRIR